MTTQREPNNQWDDAPLRIVGHRLQKVDEPIRSTGAVSRQSQGQNKSPDIARAANLNRRAPENAALLRQVVLVDRDIDALRDIAVALRDEFDFHITISGTEAINLLQAGAIDTIVVGQTLYSSTGLNVLAQARQHAPQTRRVLLANAVEAGSIERSTAAVAPFRVMQRPCTADKLRELLTSRDEDSDEPVVGHSANAPLPQARASSATHDPSDFEHVIMETPPERPRARSRATGNAAVANTQNSPDALPVIVYTDNAEFYQAISLALQDRHDVRLCTQLERASEFAEVGLCPILITDRAGTQAELQRISIALRALDANTLVIAAGPVEVSAALRKLLGTPALHSFLPKPVSTPLARLIVESAKRQYLQAKTPSLREPELQTAAPTKSLRSRMADQQVTQPQYFTPSYRDDFAIDSFEDSPWRQAAPKIAIAVAAVLIIGIGAWYGWNHFLGGDALRANSPSSVTVVKSDATDLELAQLAFDAGRYATPSDQSALFYYSEILAREPQNPAALAGRERTVIRIIEQAEKALLDEHLDAAAEAIATVRTVEPKNNRLPFLESQLEKMRRQLTATRNGGNGITSKASNGQNAGGRAGASEAPFDTSTPISNESQRQQLVARSIATGRQRLAQEKLLAPENDSAEFYFRQAERADPENVAVRQGLREIGTRLLSAARDALERQQITAARQRANDALRFGADRTGVERLISDIEAAANTSTRASLLRLALQRTRENRLFEPDRDSAKYYLGQLQNADNSSSETEQARRAFALKLIENADQALAQRQTNNAQQLINEVRRMGYAGDELIAAEARIRSTREPTPPPAVAKRLATPPPKALKIVQPKFPDEAMRAGVAGWVDVGFQITAKGDVTDVAAVASNPPGPYAAQFERAAIAAISQYKFEARNINDAEVTQRMVVRVQFKVQ